MKIKKKKEKSNNVHFETNKHEVKASGSLFIAHLTRKQNAYELANTLQADT